MRSEQAKHGLIHDDYDDDMVRVVVQNIVTKPASWI
jgi:hypothetical protein